MRYNGCLHIGNTGGRARWYSGGSRGEGGPGGPDPPIRPDTCVILELLHRQDRISLLKWLIISMKRALNFATKLHSRDIKKKLFWGTQLVMGAHRLRNTWSSL